MVLAVSKGMDNSLLRDFEPRLYQETIFATAAQKDTLVVLPTGMGKTGVALLVASHRLSQHPSSKVIFLAPTKPLVEQHRDVFVKNSNLPEESLIVFTGEVPPEKRQDLFQKARIIFSTPQGLENDVLGNKIDLKCVSLLIFDEAHHATGDYSYVFLAKKYQRSAEFPRILALTASPGSDIEKIDEVCKNLFIEAVEVRTQDDPDVRPYVQDLDVKNVFVELPDRFREVKKFLDGCVKDKVSQLREIGITSPLFMKRDFLALQSQLTADLASGERDVSTLRGLSLVAELLKVEHARELLETQGVFVLLKYFEKLISEAETSKVKAVKNLVRDLNFKSAFIKTRSLVADGIDHPKLNSVREIVEKEFAASPLTKMILFTQFRDTAVKVESVLKSVPNVVPTVFVGQAKKGETGLSQKKQRELIDSFRDGLCNVLIATSVAEEGLDIPAVDLVLFYEPVPSAIRKIQRMGRTGRHSSGKVIVLVTKGTRDEGYSWSAKHKEVRMQKVLSDLRSSLENRLVSRQVSHRPLVQEKLKVVADYREKGSGVVKILSERDVELQLAMLDCADFVVSSRVGVEVKQVADFVNSIIDGRLLSQLKDLKQRFDRPVIVLQGSEDIFSVRNVHPNAILGMLATIAVSYGIPIIPTKSESETADFLMAIARREQDEGKKEFSWHPEKRVMSLPEQQVFIVNSFPSVGPSLAKDLLRHFKTVKNIVNADEKLLKDVQGVGEKIAKNIKDAVERDFVE